MRLHRVVAPSICQSTRGLPYGDEYPRLVNGFLRDFLELHDELIDDVERELSSETTDAARQGA